MQTPHMTDSDIRELLKRYPLTTKGGDGEDAGNKEEQKGE